MDQAGDICHEMAARNLSSQLVPDFSANVRSRGYSIHADRLVHIQQASPVKVVAVVYGSRAYKVLLDWDNDCLNMSCDCPHFESSGPCKHLWATILAVDKAGHLAAARSSLDLLPIYEGWEDDLFDAEDGPLFGPRARVPHRPAPPPQKRVEWREKLAALHTGPDASASGDVWPAARRIEYVVDAPETMGAGSLVLGVWTRDRKKDETWAKLRELRLTRRQIPTLPDSVDREILALLAGAKQYYASPYYQDYDAVQQRYLIPHPLAGLLMPMMARTGRCGLRSNPTEEPAPVAWDEGGPWRLALELRRRDGIGWVLTGTLRRGDERLDLAAPVLLTAGGLVFTRDRVAPLDENTPFEWISHLRKAGAIEAPPEDAEQLLGALLESRNAPELDIPEELHYEEVRPKPLPCLRVRSVRPYAWNSPRLHGELWFEYEGRAVPASTVSRGFWQPDRRFVVRDREAEAVAAQYLREVGFRWQPPSYQQQPVWDLAPKKLPGVVRALLLKGWHVEADGKTFRRPGSQRLEISSGVDWFELRGEVDYGGASAKLPDLLQALRRGEGMVPLGDGSYGLLPEEWLSRFGPLAGLGSQVSDHLRFQRSQAGLLDALLAAQPEIRYDEVFARAREQLRRFEGVRVCEQPAGFAGRLRDYQCEGLGWMHFLREFGFGGCLADDMGVGKTAQVLALLESLREQRTAPSLVVVPKSLVFNWKLEAARFTPQLRVLDYTGPARRDSPLGDYDVIITTYGTLRRDALQFKDFEFDYIVLDEAQCVKNADTESAKAVRLLRGRHRLALSGTPVENHLGELWSLFEFLNPGMLGAARVFQLAGGPARNPSEETRRLLGHALRPFILRRTKEQVARELPPKFEQTLYCEMEAGQRRLYNELRDHYRSTLLQRIDAEGLAKSKMHVLEALLRLRQAACHPGLLDPKRIGEDSAKIDMLMEHLADVMEEGHKALVYSQFTSFLRIVQNRLAAEGITYEYLDGSTSNRQAPVERFQTDPKCPLFLISLKAGGLGLNLTAAGYVFLLDPWWNPAVEAQAVDRTHRIGQTQQVFAYRLIARDTVEEKVLELQKTKRDLAAAILCADNSLIRDLRREDLELLLS